MQLASGFMQLAAAKRRHNKVHFYCLFEGKMLIVHLNGDNHIQNFHLGRYIVGYMFGNHVLRLRLCITVKLNFRPYIRLYISPNENFEYSYPLKMRLGTLLFANIMVWFCGSPEISPGRW